MNKIKLRQQIEGFHLPGQHDQADHNPYGGEAQHAALTSKLVEQLKSTDGFSYQPKLKMAPIDGFMVSPYKEREKTLTLNDLDENKLMDYAIQNKDLLNELDHFIGGWLDRKTQIVYIDVSTQKKTLGEAARVAKEKNQEAIFDVRRGIKTDDGTLYTKDIDQFVKQYGESSNTTFLSPS